MKIKRSIVTFLLFSLVFVLITSCSREIFTQKTDGKILLEVYELIKVNYSESSGLCVSDSVYDLEFSPLVCLDDATNQDIENFKNTNFKKITPIYSKNLAKWFHTQNDKFAQHQFSIHFSRIIIIESNNYSQTKMLRCNVVNPNSTDEYQITKYFF